MVKKFGLRVVGYVRVSTAEQATEGESLAAQQKKIEQYCETYDLELVGIIRDGGASGKNLKRPGLTRALKMLDKGEAAGLVVAKLDRLTRSIRDWNSLIDGYFSEKAGGQLFSVYDAIDTTTAGGRLVLNMLLSVSQWEREAIGERTRDALRYKISQGERCGKVRFGYDLAADGKSLVPNTTEQRAIALMRKLREAGESLRAIARELNRRGIQTKEGRPWVHTSVEGILARAA